MTQLPTLNIPASVQITSIDCRVFGGSPSCVLLTKANIIGDINLNYNGFEQTLSIASNRAYLLYQDYQPTNWNFDAELLVTKANNANGEVMLVYSRSSSSDNNIWWGMTTDQYYNVKGSKMTKSVPYVFKNSKGSSVIRFTQNQLVDQADAPSTVFKAFKTESSLLILNSNIDENEAKSVNFVFNKQGGAQGQSIPISDFFDKHPAPGPNPPGPTPAPDDKKNNNWLIYLLGGLSLVLAITVVALLMNKSSEDEDDEDGDAKGEGYTDFTKENDTQQTEEINA